MNIALFSDTFLPMPNGVVVHILELSQALGRKGHHITICVPKPGRSITVPMTSSNIKIHYLPSLSFPLYNDYRLSLGETAGSFKKIVGNCDIIHVHTPMTLGLCGTYIAKRLHIPLVHTFHAYFTEPEYFRVLYLHKIGLGNNPFVAKLMWWYARKLYNSADAVIAPSEHTKKYLRSHNIHKPIYAISNGIDVNLKAPSVYFKLPQQYFLYVGRISYEKDIDILLNSFKLFCLSEHLTDLVLVGNGPADKAMRQLAKTLGIQKRVHFLGYVDHTELLNSNIYPNALAFVTASKSETQGVSLLEAMIYSLPLVVVDAGAVSELIEDNGIICRSGDIKEFAAALRGIVTDSALSSKMGQQSGKLVQNHSIEKTAEKIENLYRLLI